MPAKDKKLEEFLSLTREQQMLRIQFLMDQDDAFIEEHKRMIREG